MPRTAKVVAFSTTPQMAEEIDLMAAEEGRTRSELLREAVRAYRTRGDVRSPQVAESAAGYAATLTIPSLPGLARVLCRRPDIANVCAEARVARLWVFGSAVRDDFDEERSDFDFLVEFCSDVSRKPWLGEITDLRDSLSRILGARVDLGEAGALRNPYVLATVDAEKVLIYELA